MRWAPVVCGALLAGCASEGPDISGIWETHSDYLDDSGEPICGAFDNSIHLAETGEMILTTTYELIQTDETGQDLQGCPFWGLVGTLVYQYSGTWQTREVGDLTILAMEITDASLDGIAPPNEGVFAITDDEYDNGGKNTMQFFEVILSGVDLDGEPYLWINNYGMHRHPHLDLGSALIEVPAG